MTVDAFGSLPSLPPKARLVVEIFRRLAAFREDYDEAVLRGLMTVLCRHMAAAEADKVMSDVMIMHNEICFRVPRGLAFNDPGDAFASAHERALLLLIAHAAEPSDDEAAAEAAEALGIDSHRVLRICASLVARSLAGGGVDVASGLPVRDRISGMRFPGHEASLGLSR